MSDFDISLDERRSAAALVSADPAFAALEVSGAPIVVVAGDPLRVVHVNVSAQAVFGEDADALGDRLLRGDEAGARRLVELIESVRHGSAPRLERLRFSFGSIAQTVTILCRRLAGPNGPSYFVIAALGVRPAPAVEPPPPALTELAGAETPTLAKVQDLDKPATEDAARPEPEPAPTPTLAAATDDSDEPTRKLRARLAARFGALAPRFVWRTDAAGRFTLVTHVLADVAGKANADILGREVADIARMLSLGDAFPHAMVARKSWSGVDVDWPLDETGARAPITLGALPIFDQARRFAGFQGFGVLQLSRATILPTPAASEAAPAPHEPQTAPQECAGGQDYTGDNVVPLRPLNNSATRDGETDRAASDAGLTPPEQTAFEEIARALGGDVAQTIDPSSQDDAMDAGVDATPRAVARLLDRLPVGVLVARGAKALFANRTLLDYLAHNDLAALNADGGLARIFFGRPPGDAADRAPSPTPMGAVEVQTRDGEALDVDAHLQTIDWDGGPATLITLRRHRAPAPRAQAVEAGQSLQASLSRAREEARELRASLDASAEAIALLTSDGRIDSVNKTFGDLLEADAAALVGQEFVALVAEDDARLVTERLRRVRSIEDAGAPTDDARIRIKSRRGALTPVQLTIRRFGAGPEGKFRAVLRDLAPLQRSLDEIEAARAEAERASAAKSDFLARVSHEIRTPLNAIIGFAEVMMQERFGPIGSQRYKEYLKDVHTSGSHVLSLVNDLLDLAKIEAGKAELAFDRVDANAIIGECVSIMQVQANQERVIMRLSLAPRLPRIRADERSLRQILLNLLSNAVKFNEAGGQVIVSSALTEAGFVVIRVKDTGLGMSDEDVRIALEPFKQLDTSRKAQGTGLGLPVTKALIEANHASFTIKSRKNEGTLVEVAFPPPQVLAAE